MENYESFKEETYIDIHREGDNFVCNYKGTGFDIITLVAFLLNTIQEDEKNIDIDDVLENLISRFE